MLPTEERFWARVNKNGPVPVHRPELGPCWAWTGAASHGYGMLLVGDRMCRAHRLSWAIEHGVLPGDMCVCHRCDNPLCVRPDHLFLGTRADNAADMVSKGRWNAKGTRRFMYGDQAPSRRHPETVARGERAALAKLTEENVRDVFKFRQQGETHRSIASRFGVSSGTIGFILRRETWGHLNIDTPVRDSAH